MHDGITRTQGAIAARLLFLSASASDRSPLAVDREYNRVKAGLQSLGVWPAWHSAVEHVPAATWAQVPEQLLLHRASIVHFAGHGHPDGSLDFATPTGAPQRIAADGLAQVLEGYAHEVRLVVLNACYSDALAEALTAHVDVVIGMTHAVSDEAAILFAPAFYQQLAGGKSVQTACEVAHGVVRGAAAEVGAILRDAESPGSQNNDALPRDDAWLHMRVRAGIDASTMVFAVRSATADAPASDPQRLATAARRRAVLGLAAAAILVTLLGARIAGHGPPADRLVVRTYEQGSPDSVVRTSGWVTLTEPDAGVRKKPLVNGEAVFDGTPSVAGRTVEVSIDGAAGFQATTERKVVPEGGVLDVALARAEATSSVTGTVFDERGQPVAGAVIDIDHGRVTGKTDPSGHFHVVVPLAPGATVPVVVALDGVVGFRDNLTVPGEMTLRWAP